jgi:hypothetical protein
MWCQVIAGLFTCAGCLPDRASLHDSDPPAAPTALLVQDHAGAVWSQESIPRVPRLRLTFASPPDRAESRLWLVSEGATPDVLEDLADPPLRAATQHSLVPLTVTREGNAIWAEPEEALSPGGRYALVFTRGEAEPRVFALQVSTSPASGASWVESWPGDRDLRVPTNAARLLLRFDGYLRDLDAAHVRLSRAGTQIASTLEVTDCEALALPAGDCAWLTLTEPLSANSSYELAITDGLVDVTNAELSPRTISFATISADDDQAPALSAIPCAVDEAQVGEACLLAREESVVVRGLSNEPAMVTLTAGGEQVATLALSGTFALEIGGLTKGASTPLSLHLEDLAGNARAYPLSIMLPASLAPLAIDEVRPDPLGPEPAQEYVELLNFGPDPLQIMGFSLTDDAFHEGLHIVTPLEMAAGERVLVVAPDFDPANTADGALPGGVRLARLEGALSLRNEGAALFLRDPSGARVAESPRLAPAQAGQCIARVEHGGSFLYQRDPAGACTPGAATSEARP